MEAAPTRKPAVSFIFVTLVIMMLGVGLIIPVLPELVKQFKGGDVAEGSGWYGILVAVWATMQFVASPILGALSDRFGRRRVILIALAGSCIDYLLMGLAFHVIYFGFPSPFRLITWLHVLGWPFYVVLGLLRWIFFPFAVIALVFFVLVLLYNRRR